MYIDTLVKVKNALARKRDKIKIPYSRMDLEVLESLVKRGYLEEVVRKGRGAKRIIEIRLKYEENESPVMSGLKILSKPSHRAYVGWREIRKSHQGYGSYFLSTSKGIMSEADARRNKVGGELLFEIW
ncbi:MAG: 30S ribosomal protein S8 [Candidatus Colwellbacteria bacterium]|nr:30S ribosomal protein S8 [Candidatus Colwellbacteria bacterium]MBI3273977.1 30S ribosomal protein S8 [Candidatus Colwellbacteria bacterium]